MDLQCFLSFLLLRLVQACQHRPMREGEGGKVYVFEVNVAVYVEVCNIII